MIVSPVATLEVNAQLKLAVAEALQPLLWTIEPDAEDGIAIFGSELEICDGIIGRDEKYDNRIRENTANPRRIFLRIPSPLRYTIGCKLENLRINNKFR